MYASRQAIQTLCFRNTRGFGPRSHALSEELVFQKHKHFFADEPTLSSIPWTISVAVAFEKAGP